MYMFMYCRSKFLTIYNNVFDKGPLWIIPLLLSFLLVLTSKVFPSTLPPPGRSLSEGDGESVVRNLEKVKAFLRQKIELRKPPSLFNIPNTSPLFHQVSSTCICTCVV